MESFPCLQITIIQATYSNEAIQPSEKVPDKLCYLPSVDLSNNMDTEELINQLPGNVVVTEPRPQSSTVTSIGPHNGTTFPHSHIPALILYCIHLCD